MTADRTLLLLSCSHHKQPDGELGTTAGRSFVETLAPATQTRILELRNELRRMLRGGPPRLYNEDMRGGYRDERLPNRQLANGPDFGGFEAAAYLPANRRYSGRFFDQLTWRAPNFWQKLPPAIEVIFVSALYGLVFWDEAIQDYDCHFADFPDDLQRRKVADRWRPVLSDALVEFVGTQSRSSPIRAVYDLLSESLYQNLFSWNKIQGAPVYHRIFKGISGPDILNPLARILAAHISRFDSRRYKEGWHDLPDGEEPLHFGFERKLGEDREAAREGDFETTRTRLLTEQPWLSRMSAQLRERVILAELSWRKVEDIPQYEWGGLVVSFAKPVERFLKGYRGLSGAETLGDAIRHVRDDRDWAPTVVADLEKLEHV